MGKLIIDLSADEVERILGTSGEETEASIRIKEFVTAEVVRRYAKVVLNQNAVQKVISDLQKDTNTVIKNYCDTELKEWVVTKTNWGKHSFSLTELTKKTMQVEIAKAFKAEVREMVELEFKKQFEDFKQALIEEARDLFKTEFEPVVRKKIGQIASSLATDILKTEMTILPTDEYKALKEDKKDAE